MAKSSSRSSSRSGGRPTRGTGSAGPKKPGNPSGRSQYGCGGKRS